MVDEDYVFLKRLCQVLVHLGVSQLAPLWVRLLSAPGCHGSLGFALLKCDVILVIEIGEIYIVRHLP